LTLTLISKIYGDNLFAFRFGVNINIRVAMGDVKQRALSHAPRLIGGLRGRLQGGYRVAARATLKWKNAPQSSAFLYQLWIFVV
jgi:hypothetical protein